MKQISNFFRSEAGFLSLVLVIAITLFTIPVASQAGEIKLPARCLEAQATTVAECKAFLKAAVEDQKALRKELREQAQLLKLDAELDKVENRRKVSH